MLEACVVGIFKNCFQTGLLNREKIRAKKFAMTLLSKIFSRVFSETISVKNCFFKL